MCVLWKNVSKDCWINLCASLEDWLVWWMCTRSRRLLHKEGTKGPKPPESCCHWNYRYLHQRLLSTVSWFSESRHLFLARSKTTLSVTAWDHQAASAWAKLRIYPRTLSFELWHSLNQVNDWEGKGKHWDSEIGGQGRRCSWTWWIMYGEAKDLNDVLP